MISVEIRINGEVIKTVSAVNTGKCSCGVKDCRLYETNTANIIEHRRSKGAVELAKKMLLLADVL